MTLPLPRTQHPGCWSVVVPIYILHKLYAFDVAVTFLAGLGVAAMDESTSAGHRVASGLRVHLAALQGGARDEDLDGASASAIKSCKESLLTSRGAVGVPP